MRSQMIALVVGGGGNLMGVCSLVVKFGGTDV
jgi:hypothetical protein